VDCPGSDVTQGWIPEEAPDYLGKLLEPVEQPNRLTPNTTRLPLKPGMYRSPMACLVHGSSRLVDDRSGLPATAASLHDPEGMAHLRAG
jgi:hypothetical protein